MGICLLVFYVIWLEDGFWGVCWWFCCVTVGKIVRTVLAYMMVPILDSVAIAAAFPTQFNLLVPSGEALAMILKQVSWDLQDFYLVSSFASPVDYRITQPDKIINHNRKTKTITYNKKFHCNWNSAVWRTFEIISRIHQIYFIILKTYCVK